MVLEDPVLGGAVLTGALHLAVVLVSGLLGHHNREVPVVEEIRPSPHASEALEGLLEEVRSLKFPLGGEPPVCPAPAPECAPEASGGWCVVQLAAAGSTSLVTGFALGWCCRRKRRVSRGARQAPRRDGGGILQ